MTQIKIFGREPALWLSAIGAVLAWAVSLGLDWLNAGQATAIVTFLSAVLIAVTTRPVGPSLFVGAVAAGAALFAEYQLQVSDAFVTGLGGIILAGFAFFGIREKVTPVADPRPVGGRVATVATKSRPEATGY